MNYKRLCILVILFLIVFSNNIVFSVVSTPEEVNVDINENKVTITGRINAKNEDITLIVYRDSDNLKAYIDQGKTDDKGEFSFEFTLQNGTYLALLNADGKQYTTEKITVYKTIEDEEPEDINVNIDKNKVTITGKINAKNEDITLIVYRDSDNSKAYLDQAKTDGSGNFNFEFTLQNGTYFAVFSTEGRQYITDAFMVQYTKPGGGGDKTPTPKPIPDTEPIVLPTDIDEHWAKQYIEELIKKGIISCYPDNTFRPDNSITRAEFVTIVVKAFDFKANELNVFDDTIDHWAMDYISAAIENRIILGYGNNMFGPDDLITREQMTIIICKAMGLSVEFGEISFIDSNQVSEWALDYVASAVRKNIINGYPDNTFRPKIHLSRAEAATVIYNAIR
jgi:hypothetical protein